MPKPAQFALGVRQDVVAAAERFEIDCENNGTVNLFILVRTVLFVEEAEVEAVTIVADADRIPQELALFEIVARTAIEAPSAGEIPADAAPHLLFIVRAVDMRIGI